MHLRSFLGGVAFIVANVPSSFAGYGDSDDAIVTKTITRVVYTCPCDQSASTSVLASWGAWSGGVSNKDGSGSGYGEPSNTGNNHDGKPTQGGSFDAPSGWSICYTAIQTDPNYFPKTSINTFYTTCPTPSTTTKTATATTVITPVPTTLSITVSTTTTVTGLPTTKTVTTTLQTSTTTILTETDTETDTVTQSTTTTSTTTIASSQGFTPIDTSLPGATSLAAAPAPKSKRDFSIPSGRSYRDSYQGDFSNLKDIFGAPANAHAGDVVCHYTTTSCSTNTVTATTTSTSTSTASTPTVTTSTTTTITITTIPGVNATVTTTNTNTISVTTTTTTTRTTTSIATITATASFLAACDPRSNQANYVNGLAVVGAQGSGGNQVLNGATNPYDCCVAAVNDPSALIWGLFGTVCVILEAPSACSAQTSSGAAVITVTTAAVSPSATFGNANCGQINSAVTRQ